MGNVTEITPGSRDEIDKAHEALDASDEEAIRLANAGADSDSLGEAGGKSLEELTAAEDENGQQRLLDFGDTVSLTVRGKKPTDTSIKVKAISTPIKGQLGDVGDDETIVYVGHARLDKIEFVSKRADGKVVAKERKHVLDPIGFIPFRGEWAARLEALVAEMQDSQDQGAA